MKYKREIGFISKLLFILICFIFNVKKKITIKKENANISSDKCYISPEKSNLKIIHFIITRYMMERKFWKQFDEINQENYIMNGIRVIKRYLIPSLNNQSCKQFIWILMLGNKANKTYIKSLLGNNNLFESEIIYQGDIKRYIKNKSKGFDILITTRIDFDDRIYYDAVNDVRKAINPNKPMLLYGYNKGVHYYEIENKYYEFHINYKKRGCMSIFASLINVLNKTNDTYNIYDLGTHAKIRKTLLESYKKFGIKLLDYEPAIFDSGTEKFVWVRHNYSGQYQFSEKIKKYLKEYNFDLYKFYGKSKK